MLVDSTHTVLFILLKGQCEWVIMKSEQKKKLFRSRLITSYSLTKTYPTLFCCFSQFPSLENIISQIQVQTISHDRIWQERVFLFYLWRNANPEKRKNHLAKRKTCFMLFSVKIKGFCVFCISETIIPSLHNTLQVRTTIMRWVLFDLTQKCSQGSAVKLSWPDGRHH